MHFTATLTGQCALEMGHDGKHECQAYLQLTDAHPELENKEGLAELNALLAHAGILAPPIATWKEDLIFIRWDDKEWDYTEFDKEDCSDKRHAQQTGKS